MGRDGENEVPERGLPRHPRDKVLVPDSPKVDVARVGELVDLVRVEAARVVRSLGIHGAFSAFSKSASKLVFS